MPPDIPPPVNHALAQEHANPGDPLDHSDSQVPAVAPDGSVYNTPPALSLLRSFLIFAPLIFLYTGVLGAVSLVSSFFDRYGKFQHWLARFWSKLILGTIQTPVRVVGQEYLVRSPPRLFAANHLSSLDIPVLYANLPFPFRIIAKREVFNYVVVGWHLRRSGQIEVDSSNARASLRGLNRAAETLKHGMPVVVFPEGSRSTSGEVQPFLNGAFYVAIKAQAEIVPIAIVGTLETLPMNRYHIRPHALQLVAGAPISSAGYTLRQADALAAKVKSAIEDLYYSRAHVPDPRRAQPGELA